MNIRRKTVQRLLILFAAFFVFFGTVAGFIYKSMLRQRADVAGIHAAALKAFDVKDYPAAVSLFHDYVSRTNAEHPDPEDLYKYGKARIEVPEKGNHQVPEAIDLLQRYLDLAPSDPHDAGHDLLKLYVRSHYNNQEARSLAARLLAKNPKDVEALRARAESYDIEHNAAEAAKVCANLNEVDPFNLFWQTRELQEMAAAQQSPEKIVSHAKQLLDAHPDDARFHALMGVAYGLANDKVNSIKSLETAARLPPADSDANVQIITMLDEVQKIDLSDEFLARALAKEADPRLERMSLQRLFERQRYAELEEKLKDLDLKSPKTLPALVGYRAMGLFELRRKPEADAIVNVLAQRQDDWSFAWAEALRARYADKALEPAALIKAYSDAANRDRANPVFRMFLGDARASVGETDAAIQEWRYAARMSATWPLPIYRISRTLSANGRFADALRAANSLRRRAPEMLPSQIAFVIAGWGVISNNPALVNGGDGEALLKTIEAIRSKVPAETDTLPTYVAILSRRGQRDKAIEVAKAALSTKPPLPESVFGQLSAVSNQEHLGLEQMIIDQAEKAHGVTPAVAYARIYAMYEEGKKDDGQKMIESFRQSHPNDPVWQITEARFRETVGDPDALKIWIAVADAHPKDVRVQYQALDSRSRYADQAFWQRTIDRVKALTGPDAQAWQIEQARYHLAGQASAQELDADIALLQKVVVASPELEEVHRLLAEAMLRTGKPDNATKAIAELTTAHDLQPDDFQASAELAPLLASRGMHDKALSLVDSVCKQAGLPLGRRLWAAGMYSDLGYTDAGIKILTSDATTQPSPDRDAILANLYSRAGRVAEATALYQKVLDDPTARVESLGAGANFFAASNQPDMVNKFIGRLQTLSMAPGTIEVIRAELDEMAGKPQDAVTALLLAAKAHPSVEQLWQELSGVYLRQGKLDQADTAAVTGLEAIPNAPGLMAMRSQIDRIRTVGVRDIYPLVRTLSHTPRHPAADAAMKLLADAKMHNDAPPQVLTNLRQLADKYSGYLPLQEVVIRRYLAASRFAEANEVAARTCEIAPYDLQSLQLLTTVQFAAKNWEGARSTALRWRQASGANTLDPDVNIALTYLAQPTPDPEAALKQLDPYMADKAPDAPKLAATPIYCRALMMAGRPDEAANRLLPLIDKSPRWIAAWLELATLAPKDVDTASQWLKRIQPKIALDSAPQVTALAGAWEQVGQKFDSSPAHETSRDLLKTVISQPDPPAAAWWEWAIVNQSLANLPEAERGWQEYMKLNPKDPQGFNNLAYVLLLEGDPAKLPKAAQLATDAIAAVSTVSTFYDTLGRIQFQSGKKDDAIKSFRLALERDPNDLDAMIGLADTLRFKPSGREEVRTLLSRINAMLDAGTTITPPIREQLDRVKTAMSSL
jgi:tetratricopeptide (TPR) repeat protein